MRNRVLFAAYKNRGHSGDTFVIGIDGKGQKKVAEDVIPKSANLQGKGFYYGLPTDTPGEQFYYFDLATRRSTPADPKDIVDRSAKTSPNGKKQWRLV